MPNEATRRSLLAALPAVGLAPAAAVAGLPETEAAEAASTESRIRQFAEWFHLEVPSLVFEPNKPEQPILTDELFAWINDNGASFDWIFFGDAHGIAATFRKRYAAHEADPHPAWLQEWLAQRDAYEDWDNDPGDDELLWERMQELGNAIALTPAATTAGAAAQIEYAIEDFGPHIFGSVAEDLDEKTLRSAVETLRRLA